MFVETTVWVWQRSSSFPSSTNPVGEGCQGSNKASTAAESAGRVREMSAAVVECEEVERGCHCRIAHLHSLGGGCSSSAAQLELSARQSQGQQQLPGMTQCCLWLSPPHGDAWHGLGAESQPRTCCDNICETQTQLQYLQK